MKQYDIFISYKRKSLPTANNLYYRLTTRGYSTFFDLEEMGRDNFNVQLLNYIENAKDVFVILEEGSLDACKKDDWENDWFCREIAFALEKKKNIIPILINGYEMPSKEFFPDELKDLRLKNAPEFNFSFFEAYLDKLIEKEYLLSKPNLQEKTTSIFKFYSNENCQVFKEGKLVCSLEGMSDEPYYLPVPRKGDYRFKAVNGSTSECQILNETIDAIEEKNIEIKWSRRIRINNLFSGNHRGCSLSVSITLILAVVIIPIGMWMFNNTTTDSNQYVEGASKKVNRTSKQSTDTSKFVCAPVDLGLPSGTLWGDRNVGAINKFDYGTYFYWGGIKPIERQSKNIIERADDIIGTSYDAASILLGDFWSLPSEKQVTELINSCKWEWISDSVSKGYLIIGPNKKSIFLPVSGCVKTTGVEYEGQFGYYWIGESHSINTARQLLIGKEEINIEYGQKRIGRTIRAVNKNQGKS